MASKNPDPSVAFWGALIVAPTMALGGALIGAATGDPKRTMYDIDKIASAPELFSTLSGTNSFRNRLLDQLVEHSGQIGHSLQSFPAVAAEWPSPIPEKIEGMIAVNIREFGLTNQVDNPHDVALLVKGTLTIYQRDRFGTFWGEWSYVSDHRSIANWSANDAELFRKEIDKAAGVAAGRIATCLRPQYSDTLDGERDEPASQGGMPDC